MAITYNLPIKDWYFDTTSEWTLDYPPLFAAFEFLLGLIAHVLNLTDTLALTESPNRTESTIVYQKITVILSDCLYYYAVYKLCHSLKPLVRSNATKEVKNNKKGNDQAQQQQQNVVSSDQILSDAIYRPDATSCIALLLLLQPGLLLVDHIHFQYNGFLSGILLLSLASIIEGRYFSGSFWFALLLNFKHIYLYCAPAYGMYILASYCMAKVEDKNRIVTFISKAGRLGSVVILIFVIIYFPFGDQKTLRQIVNRLFPFKRGLTHAYWAPNAWSIYNLVDKILATIFKDSLKVTFDLESISRTKTVTSTSGLVQEYDHQHLPSVKPLTTFVLVGCFMVPIVVKFLFRIGERSSRLFMKGVTLAAFTSFMFGWHVHEKAIILVLLPMIPISFTDPNLRDTFLRLTLAGTYSLFPLLFKPGEYMTKLTILLAYYSYARSQNPMSDRHNNQPAEHQSKDFLRPLWCKLYSMFDRIFVIILVLNELYITLIHGRLNYGWNPLARLNKYDFLPLMLTSGLSALGIASSYLELYYDFLI